MRMACVRNGLVENIVIATPGLELEGYHLIPIEGLPVNIGDHYDGTNFTPAPVVLSVPERVTPVQMRIALNEVGLRDMIEGYVATLPRDARDRWDYGLTVERDNPVIEAGRLAMGMSEEQVDDLFRLAESKG